MNKRKWMNISPKTIRQQVVLVLFILSVCISFLVWFIHQSDRAKHDALLYISEKNQSRNQIHEDLLSVQYNVELFSRSHERMYWYSAVFCSDLLGKSIRRFADFENNRPYQKRFANLIQNICSRIDDLNQAQELPDEDLIRNLGIAIDSAVYDSKQFTIQDYNRDSSNYQEKIEKLNLMQNAIQFILFGLILLCIFSIFKLTGIILKNLRQTGDNLTRLTLHKWDTTDLSQVGYAELDQLNQSVNQLKNELITYLAEIRQKAMLQKQLDLQIIENEKMDKEVMKLKLINIQEKINPHFLFNSLNMIGKSSLLSRPEMAMHIIECLSTILRHTLENNAQTDSLENELEIVDNYIQIQKYRFGNRLSFSKRILVDTQIMLPSLSLQTLIENSFKHGFKQHKHLKLELLIQAEKNSDLIRISVRDNGAGFANQASALEKGHGLSTLAKTLELYYERKDLLRIDSKPNQYTIVTFFVKAEGMAL